MRLRPSTQRNSQSASSSAEVRPLGPHAPTFLALVVEERRSVVPHVEAHPPHRSVAFRARCRLPHPDALPNPCSARRHSLSSSREEIERGAPVADALGKVDDRPCSLGGATDRGVVYSTTRRRAGWWAKTRPGPGHWWNARMGVRTLAPCH